MRIIVQETNLASNIVACGTYGKGETQDYRVKVVKPTTDLGISQIISPSPSDCPGSGQLLTVKISNYGTGAQSNIPLLATITAGATTVANLSFTFPGPLAASESFIYTFQTPFTTAGATAYTISVTTNKTGDQLTSNNALVTSITSGAKQATPVGEGEICGTNVFLKVTNADQSNYYWYSSPTATSPFSLGSSTSTTTIPSDKTYYVQKEAVANIGPANRSVFSSGGYNVFSGNYVKINNTVPLNIETARLYIKNGGKIKFTVADLVSEDANTGGYRYTPLSTQTIDVYPTTPNPGPDAQALDANDTGAVYRLNLAVPSIGDHIIIIECQDRFGQLDTIITANNANIFRNNAITGTSTYPIAVPGIMSITGNSAHFGTSKESQFYYFFYNMKVNTGACTSDRSTVVAVNAAVPSVTQQGDSLISSAATGNQWYLNDTTVIANANGKIYKPTKSGKYKVVVTDAFGCQQSSNTINYAVTATFDVIAREIKLTVSPNPNRGIFNLSFEVSTRADLSIELLSASGQRVYQRAYSGFTGKYSQVIRLDDLSSEFYVLKIVHDKKTYLQKVLIMR
jgi:hypothetical protein